MTTEDKQAEYLTGQLIIAMPTMSDPRFARTVIYMCVHDDEGALGLVVNKLRDDVIFADLLELVEIESLGVAPTIPIHVGGPVQSGRGFVLHSTDYHKEGTNMVAETIGLTATIDILRDIAEGQGPRKALLALGYAGWGAGQLDSEIQRNGWLHVPADDALVFDSDIDTKWERSIAKIGFDPSLLAGEAGHA